MVRLAKIASLGGLFLTLGAAAADAASSIALAIPSSPQEALALVPAWMRSHEFLGGLAAGVALGEAGRIAWRWGNQAYKVGLSLGANVLRYGSIAAVVGALIFFL